MTRLWMKLRLSVFVPLMYGSVVLGGLLGTIAPVHAEDSKLNCINGTAELQLVLDKIQSLSAEFHQQVSSADGYSLQEMEGVMHIARPGRIYWKTVPPYEQLVVSDGEKLWLYDPDLEQVTIKALAENLVDSPAALLVGKADNLADRYQICKEISGGALRIAMTPLEQSSVYTHIVLTFESDAPASITMTDSLGQHTEVTLAAVALNPELEASLFVFNPPDGVDVFLDR